MNLNKFMEKSYKIITTNSGYTYSQIRPRVFCKDGTSLSVQGSENHYCSPRQDGKFFNQVEVGHPSIRPPKSWKQYSEEDWIDLGIVGTITRAWSQFVKYWNCPVELKFLKKVYAKSMFTDSACDTIYAYIPISLVKEFINLHGGIDEVKTFEEKK